MENLYNSWDKQDKNPFGAIKRLQPCEFSINLPQGVTPDYPPTLVVFRTGFKERFLQMNLIGEENSIKRYHTTFIPKYAGVHYYYFAYTSGGVRHYIKRGDACHAFLDNGEMYQLTVTARHYQTPTFLKGGVMYQIFPDRFCNSGTPKENIPYGRVDRTWGELPYYRPDQNGHVWNNDYFGGDLEGIRQHLDYFKDLGVTCLYLNPIFESHENHRYCTANYRNVDPHLGTNEDFARLCADAQKYGISIIIDGVFSHTGADSIYFNKFDRYDNLGAWQGPDSEYYSWYNFYGADGKEYESWWGIDTLPNVDENNPTYTKYICGDGGVLQYWLELGAAGWRLDVADELPDQFLDNLHNSVKSYDPEKIIIGEVWEDASNKEAYGVKRRYLLGDQLDSVMNYPFREAVIAYTKGEASTSFRDRIMGIVENYPKCTVDVLMNFVSTHDIERAINRLGGQPCDDKSKDWMAENELTPDEYARGKAMLKTAMTLQFFLPGVPSIYYGDEVGLQGWKDPFNRRCYPWGKEDEELYAFTKRLSKIRHTLPAFVEGRIEFLVLDENVCGFARFDEETSESAIILVNRGENDATITVNDPRFDAYHIQEIVQGNVDDNSIRLTAHDYAVLRATRK